MLKTLLQNNRPLIMGIVNITPDSFSDGGKFSTMDAAIKHAASLIEEGADILDIGGESTRPGATAVSLIEELKRVMPVIESLRLMHPTTALSIDTQKPEVMRAAIEAGVAMVNDVNALRAEGAIEICANAKVCVCLMHMQKQPQVMQVAPSYEDVMMEVQHFLKTRAEACIVAGIDRSRIVIDPGIGFGKSLQHNLALLRGIPQFVATGYPTLIGVSRKSIFKAFLNREIDDRLVPSVVAAIMAAQVGAKILRVHDVRETRDALKLVEVLGADNVKNI
jgi:dihydropteroate synthase